MPDTLMSSLVLWVLSVTVLLSLVENGSSVPIQNIFSRVQDKYANEIDADGSSREVEGTLRLLDEGERRIRVDQRYRDVILVVGNTGAGKSTITQFLAGDNSNLVSYEAEDGRYLIKDIVNRTISEGRTLVSKSIFPELVIDPRTNSAYYDCPGFSDTRNASVEIANAFFIKKVADHARSVKILFIVNHSSMKSGETRTDFKTLVEHSIGLVKEPLKFQAGVALIATKVDSSWETPRIINGIAGFLSAAKTDLETVVKDRNQLAKSHALINSFLVKGGGSPPSWSRIGIFRQPDELGPLSEIRTVQQVKRSLEKMVMEDLKFVPKSKDDFGVSVSGSAQLLVTKIGESYNNRLSDQMRNLGLKIQQYYLPQVEKTVFHLDLLPKLKDGGNILRTLLNNLTLSGSTLTFDPSSRSPLNREEIFNLILNAIKSLEIPDLEPIYASISSDLKVLQFLETVRRGQLPIRRVEWSQPLVLALDFLTDQTHKFQQKIDTAISLLMEELAQDFVHDMEEEVQKSQDFYTLHKFLQNSEMAILNLTQSLQSSHNLLQYFSLVAEAVKVLNMSHISQKIEDSWLSPLSNLRKNSGSILIPLPQPNSRVQQASAGQNPLGNSASPMGTSDSPYRPSEWTSGFVTPILKSMSRQQYNLAHKMNTKIQDSLTKLEQDFTRQLSISMSTTTATPIKKNQVQQLIDNLASRYNKLSLAINSLRKARTLRDFSNPILPLISDFDLGRDSTTITTTTTMSSLWTKLNQKYGEINLFDPIGNEASPFKPLEWLDSLNKMLQLLQDKISQLSKILDQVVKKEEERAREEERRINQQKIDAALSATRRQKEQHAAEQREWARKQQENEANRREWEKKERELREEKRRIHQQKIHDALAATSRQEEPSKLPWVTQPLGFLAPGGVLKGLTGKDTLDVPLLGQFKVPTLKDICFFC